MNWVKYYGAGYYGTMLLADWVADMKHIDASKLTAASVVVKETGSGVMPGLMPAELEQWTTSFVETIRLDILMPQDGAGAQAGAPPIGDLPRYFSAMATAIRNAGTNTSLWSAIETFTADPNRNGERYRPADISRIQRQISQVSPYVSGYVSWIFGDDMSPQATYYPVEAGELDRQYKDVFGPSR